MVTTEGFDELFATGGAAPSSGGTLTLPRPTAVADRGPTPVSALPRRRDLRRAERSGRGSSSARVAQAASNHQRAPEPAPKRIDRFDAVDWFDAAGQADDQARRDPGPRRPARHGHDELRYSAERYVPPLFAPEQHPAPVRRAHFSPHEVANRLPRRPLPPTRPPQEQVPVNDPVTGAQPWWRTGEVSALFDPATLSQGNPYSADVQTGQHSLGRADIATAPLTRRGLPELQSAPLDAVRDIAAAAGEAGMRVLDGVPATRRSRRVAEERSAWVTSWQNNPRKRVMVRGGLLLGLMAAGGTGVLSQRGARDEVKAQESSATIWSGTMVAAQTVADATDRQASTIRIGQELTTEAVGLAASRATAQVQAVQVLKNAADRAEAGRLAAIRAKAEAAAARARDEAMQRAVRSARTDPKALARILMVDHGWAGSQFSCLNSLWMRESGWNYKASNPSSGAYGIAQALPGSKMGSVASDWRTNPITQITWGLDYIATRYGSPCGAWSHSQATGWY